MSWIVYFSGKLIGGKGTYLEVRTAYAWASCPVIIGFLLSAYGKSSEWSSLLAGETDLKVLKAFPTDISQQLALYAYSVLMIWGFILQIITVSEAHQFSKWKAFFTAIAELIVVFFIAVIVGVGFAVLTHL